MVKYWWKSENTNFTKKLPTDLHATEMWSNAAKNEKRFLRNHKMLATDFHVMDRQISIGYQQRQSQSKSFGGQLAITFS